MKFDIGNGLLLRRSWFWFPSHTTNNIAFSISSRRTSFFAFVTVQAIHKIVCIIKCGQTRVGESDSIHSTIFIFVIL